MPVYKGNYEQSLSAGIAAFRTGNAPALLQVYEVGTATMMASKAIKPVYEVFKEAGINFDESQFVPTVAGYYTDSKSGHLLSQPFNSSTPVLYYNKDAFKKAGLDPEQPPKTPAGPAEYTAKLKAAGMKCGYASGWQGWIQIENFSASARPAGCHQKQRLRRYRRGAGVQQAGAGEAHRAAGSTQ